MLDNPSSLERLPPEIRLQLLGTLDISQLQALIQASPTFYQQYAVDRELLLEALYKTLGDAFPEAYAVYSATNPNSKGAQGMLISLETYEICLARGSLGDLANRLNLHGARSMVKYHLEVVEPIAERFIQETWKNLQRKTRPGQSIEAPQLTSSERHRFLRTIYRMQMLCHKWNLVSSPATWQEREEPAASFSEILQPWEVEELIAFAEFLGGIYSNIMHRVGQDVNRHIPLLGPPSPDSDGESSPGSFRFNPEKAYREEYLDGLILAGLPLVCAVMRIEEHEELVSIMQRNVNYRVGPFFDIDGPFASHEQDLRRWNRPSKCHRMEAAMIPMPFLGDNDVRAPSLGWTMIWDNLNSSFYGDYISAELRAWGYVFWDAKTLRSARADNLLGPNGEKIWRGGEGDPRQRIPGWLQAKQALAGSD